MKRWHVIQVYAGYEETIKRDIEKTVQEKGFAEHVGQILIPSAKLKTLLASTTQPGEQQLFPGYLLIEMDPVQEIMRLIQTTPRVIRVLGSLSQKEIDRVLGQMTGEVSLVAKKSDFIVGNEVEIIQGPFAGFFGVIESIDDANERLKVMVSIFGRMTPIELSFDQIKH